MGRCPNNFNGTFKVVSIQVVSPASGECESIGVTISQDGQVSIQVVSPASGESSAQRAYPERDLTIKSTHRQNIAQVNEKKHRTISLKLNPGKASTPLNQTVRVTGTKRGASILARLLS